MPFILILGIGFFLYACNGQRTDQNQEETTTATEAIQYQEESQEQVNNEDDGHDREAHRQEQEEVHEHREPGYNQDSEEQADLKHSGHDHHVEEKAKEEQKPIEASAAPEIRQEESSKETPHGQSTAFTSDYVCPMHCKGSGSEEPGKCPVCNMKYIAQAEHVANGHQHDN